MTAETYRLVSELVHPGGHFDVPAGVDPVVEGVDRHGIVRVTYPQAVKRVPIEDDADLEYVE